MLRRSGNPMLHQLDPELIQNKEVPHGKDGRITVRVSCTCLETRQLMIIEQNEE